MQIPPKKCDTRQILIYIFFHEIHGAHFLLYFDVQIVFVGINIYRRTHGGDRDGGTACGRGCRWSQYSGEVGINLVAHCFRPTAHTASAKGLVNVAVVSSPASRKELSFSCQRIAVDDSMMRAFCRPVSTPALHAPAVITIQ